MKRMFIFSLLSPILFSCGPITIDENPSDVETGLVVKRSSGSGFTSKNASTLQVGLNSNPGKEVSITPVLTQAGTRVTIEPASITLNSNSWFEGKTFTISDQCNDNLASTAFTLSFQTSSALNGYDYSNKIVKTDSYLSDGSNLNLEQTSETAISGTLTSSDYIFTEISSSTTSESGTSATLDIALCKTPAASVSVSIASNNNAEGLPSSASLTFTNAGASQSVDIDGQDDALVDGDIEYSVTVSASAYDTKTHVLTNYDNEIPSLVLSKTVVSVSETGTSDNFTIYLSKEPVSDVSISLSILDANNPSTTSDEAVLDLNQFTFTSGTFSTPKVVSITGKADSIDDGDQNFIIKIKALSGGYEGVSASIITGTNTDID